MAAAVEAGVGLGILPCYIGDALSEVVPVLDVEDGLPAEIWLVAHRSRKRDPNVRAFFDYFSSALQLDAPLFRGRSHAVAPKKKVVPA